MGPRTIADLKNWPGWIWVLNLSGTSSWFRYSFISESKIFQLDWPSANRKPGIKKCCFNWPSSDHFLGFYSLSFFSHWHEKHRCEKRGNINGLFKTANVTHSSLPDHLIFKVATIALLQLSSYHLVNQLGLHHFDTSFTTRKYCTWFFHSC